MNHMVGDHQHVTCEIHEGAIRSEVAGAVGLVARALRDLQRIEAAMTRAKLATLAAWSLGAAVWAALGFAFVAIGERVR